MAQDSLSFEQLGALFAELEKVAGASTGIAVAAELAERARLLEYGSVAGRRPWPQPGQRTVLAVDPESGARVVVSAQAPQGFIRVHAHEFAEHLTEGLSRSTEWLNAGQAQEHVAQAAQYAARQALEVIRGTVPRNSGELAASLHIVE